MMPKALAAGVAVAAVSVGCDGTFGLVPVDPPPGRDGAVNDTGPKPGGLVAHYTMDSVAGGTLDDELGLHDGSCTACPAVVAQGKVGGALKFDGTSHVIDVPASPAFSTTTGLTVAVWLRLETAPTAGMVLCAVNLRLGADVLNSWQLCVKEDRVLQVYWYDAGTHTLGAFDIGEDAWHHVALRWDGTTATLMLDGNVSTVASAPASLNLDGGAVSIGGDRDSGSLAYAWDGSIDDLWIYDHPLTDQEIADLSGR